MTLKLETSAHNLPLRSGCTRSQSLNLSICGLGGLLLLLLQQHRRGQHRIRLEREVVACVGEHGDEKVPASQHEGEAVHAEREQQRVGRDGPAAECGSLAVQHVPSHHEERWSHEEEEATGELDGCQCLVGRLALEHRLHWTKRRKPPDGAIMLMVPVMKVKYAILSLKSPCGIVCLCVGSCVS